MRNHFVYLKMYEPIDFSYIEFWGIFEPIRRAPKHTILSHFHLKKDLSLLSRFCDQITGKST